MPVPASIAVLCAWCGAKIREGPPQPARASHGICETCLERFLSDPPREEDELEAGGETRD